MARTITIETKTDIHRYRLKDDTLQLVRVRKGLYRTDELYMVPEKDGEGESVYYELGGTQPKGPGIQIPTKYTMAHCRLVQTNGKKVGIIAGFDLKYLPYALIAFAVVWALVSGGI